MMDLKKNDRENMIIFFIKLIITLIITLIRKLNRNNNNLMKNKKRDRLIKSIENHLNRITFTGVINDTSYL